MKHHTFFFVWCITALAVTYPGGQARLQSSSTDPSPLQNNGGRLRLVARSPMNHAKTATPEQGSPSPKRNKSPAPLGTSARMSSSGGDILADMSRLRIDPSKRKSRPDSSRTQRPPSPKQTRPKAQMYVEVTGEDAMGHTRNPARISPHFGSTNIQHHRLVGGGGEVEGRERPISPGEAGRVVIKGEGDMVFAKLKVDKAGGGNGRMTIPRPFGGNNEIVVKPGDTHTHQSSNGGQGKPLKLSAELTGPGELLGDAQNPWR